MHTHPIFKLCAISYDAFVLVIESAFSDRSGPNVIPKCAPYSLENIFGEVCTNLHVKIMVGINCNVPFIIYGIILREMRDPQKTRQADAYMLNSLNDS